MNDLLYRVGFYFRKAMLTFTGPAQHDSEWDNLQRLRREWETRFGQSQISKRISKIPTPLRRSFRGREHNRHD